MNKFEQLIEFVINDEEAKARELFHDIVVEKSRAIYEEMMEEEAKEEEEESVEEAKEEEESVEEGFDGAQLGGDQSDDLIDDIEVEEEGMREDDSEFDDGAEEAGQELTHDIEAGHDGEEDLEDRVVDLEDKLDELMAEFESLMGDEEAEHGDLEADMDADVGMDGEETVDDELETESIFAENVDLKAAPAPVKSEEAGINKKAVYAANSGAKGMQGSPVKSGANEGGHHDSAAYKNTPKELIGKVQNTPAQSTVSQKPATKPHLAQATGVNTKSVIQ